MVDQPKTTEEPPYPPPYPAELGWKWIWRPARAARWSARRVHARKYRPSITPRLIHNRVHYSVFSRISELILPWVYRWDYPGRSAGIREIVGERATRSAIRYWRKTDSLPLEVRDRVVVWMEADIRRRTEALAALKAIPATKPRVWGGRKPHKRRAERLAREEAARDRELNGPIPKPNVPAPPVSACRAWVEQRLGRPLD